MKILHSVLLSSSIAARKSVGRRRPQLSHLSTTRCYRPSCRPSCRPVLPLTTPRLFSSRASHFLLPTFFLRHLHSCLATTYCFKLNYWQTKTNTVYVSSLHNKKHGVGSVVFGWAPAEISKPMIENCTIYHESSNVARVVVDLKNKKSCFNTKQTNMVNMFGLNMQHLSYIIFLQVQLHKTSIIKHA